MYFAVRACALRAAVCLAAFFVAGCATPNLQPFAEQTSRLAAAVSGEHQQIDTRLHQITELYDVICGLAKSPQSRKDIAASCEQRATLKSSEVSLAESRRVIDQLLEKTVDYANSLVALAAAGETGKEAADSLLGTVKQFGTLFGVGGTLVTSTVTSVLQKVSAAVTRIQAQETLADATAAAHGAVVAVADGIVEIQNANKDTLFGLYGFETGGLLTVTGPNLVGLYQEMALRSEATNQRLRHPDAALWRVRGCDAKLEAQKAKECADVAEAWRSSEEMGKLLERLKPEYASYTAKRNDALRWRAERRANSDNIIKAAAAWKAEHMQVADKLKRCGGLRAHQCAELNVSTLKVIVDGVNELRSDRSK